MNDNKTFVLDDTTYETNLTKKFLLRKKYSPPEPKKITAFIPGTIKKIYVSEGQIIKRKEKLLVLEAMKMQNDVSSLIDGKIKRIFIKAGQRVAKNELLIEIE